MTVVYHVTSAEDANTILSEGLRGGWGDSGFGVYFYGKLYNAMAYLRNGGWDGKLDPETAVVLAVEVPDADLAFVDIDPGWPNPEDYEDVTWYPMDSDADEVLKTDIQIAYPAPSREAEWVLHATVMKGGEERSVWRIEGDGGRDVFQMTLGDEPTSVGGYHLLETLLALKDCRPQDMTLVATAPVAAAPRI